MILPLIGLILGAATGILRARLRGGKLADMAQWGAVHGMIFGVIGLFVLVIVQRSAV